jgi:3-oxoacyl-[acyl-carrier protein] reductase
MSRTLQDQVAIITGGGTGIGKAISLAFANEGAAVVAAARNLSRLEEAVKEIKSKGGKAKAIQTDISDPKQVQRMVDQTVKEFGKVDILVNNAAVWSELDPKPWETWTVEEWDRIFEVNVRGTWLCCKTIAPLMIKESKGKIINIASDIIKVPDAQFFLAYALSKSAIYTLNQCLSHALGPSGINVNAIAPGYTATQASLEQRGSEQIFEGVVAAQSIKRRQEAKDVVGAALFLASKDSDFITGQCIVVDGGHVTL